MRITAKGWLRERGPEMPGGRSNCPLSVRTVPRCTFSLEPGTMDVCTKYLKQGDPKCTLSWGFLYSKSPTYEPSSCELSKMQTCVPSMSGMSEIALCLLFLTTLQLYHLPPPLPPPVSNSSCLFTRCQPLYASCCTVLLYFSKYCTVRVKIFSSFFGFLNVLFV